MGALIATILAGVIVALITLALALKGLLDSWTNGVDLALRDLDANKQRPQAHKLLNARTIPDLEKACAETQQILDTGGDPWNSSPSQSSESYYLPLPRDKNTKSADTSEDATTPTQQTKLPRPSSNQSEPE